MPSFISDCLSAGVSINDTAGSTTHLTLFPNKHPPNVLIASWPSPLTAFRIVPSPAQMRVPFITTVAGGLGVIVALITEKVC